MLVLAMTAHNSGLHYRILFHLDSDDHVTALCPVYVANRKK